MPPQLTLYYALRTCALVPSSLLTELGIPFSAVLLKSGPEGYEAADGSLSHAQYLSIHPSGYVPALVIDGEVLTEMPAVLTFIASLAPEKKLLGGEGLQRARVAEWMAWLSGTLHGIGFAMYFRPGRFADDESQFEAIRLRGRASIETCFYRIEERLGGKSHPVGDGETVVDYNLVIFWHWGRRMGIQMEDVFPNYSRVVHRVGQKDSVRRRVLEYKL